MTKRPDIPGSQRNVVVVLTSLVHGGAETQVVELLKQFRGTDLEPRLVVSLSEELLPYGPVIAAAGYHVTALRRSSSFEFSRILALRRILVSADAHLVHAVGLLASVYCWLAAKWLSGCVVLPSIRGTVVTPGRLRRFLYGRMFRDCPCAVANSTAGASFAIEHLGAIPERLVVVPNGINFRALRAAVQPGSLRAELNIDGDVPACGFRRTRRAGQAGGAVLSGCREAIETRGRTSRGRCRPGLRFRRARTPGAIIAGSPGPFPRAEI